MMDTQDIARLLAADPYTKHIVVGVVAKDKLPKKIVTYPSAFVCNTDDADESGEPWICLYVDTNQRGEYFDSYGLPPQHATFRAFLRRNCDDWTYNDRRLQSGLSNVCSTYYVAYLMHRCRGVPLKLFGNLFGSDFINNDCCLFDWLKSIT